MDVQHATIPISSLPSIQDVWLVDQKPHLVVFRYDEFIRFVATADPENAPDVNSVLALGGECQFITLHFDKIVQYMNRFRYDGIIDEEHYLSVHDDVCSAVNVGLLSGPINHYILQGYFERRAVRILDPASKQRRHKLLSRPSAHE